MTSLYKWNGDSNQPIIDVLAKYGIVTDKISLHKYEKLTPDSYYWIFTIGDSTYYLYAEDYLTSLDEVRERFTECRLNDDYPRSKDSITILKPLPEFRYSNTYKDEGPNIARRADDFMEHCYISGGDYSFLAQ